MIKRWLSRFCEGRGQQNLYRRQCEFWCVKWLI